MNQRFHSVVCCFLMTILLSSCGRAWVISKRNDGGVIGYSDFMSEEDSTEALSKLIHCPNASFVSDDLRSSSETETVMAPIQSRDRTRGVIYKNGRTIDYSEDQASTQYVPINRTQIVTWREYSYKCPD